ncbi:3-oxoacyl-ACP reductase FabG [Natranaerofaba carboxydovora]|uniref:3-oxoacyl-ACP reductase FabG n=1 Tax=Natranaerofaba carboxydovora TaxID=2742683 RepID=UPI001F12B0DA|nr:3-oxoacyl-ACP reductase FabG [Natranaerofaba carboxydovora]UMZ72582.1 putative oxidoreductase [Natranaerofaba carboxydovora]
MKLKDKVAIITGGGSGIGKETALLFAKEGAKIVIADYEEEASRQTLNEIVDNGSSAIFVKTDVKEIEEVEKMIEKTLEEYGEVDILVNNAGITRDGLLKDISNEQWNKVLEINLTGVFNCTKTVSQVMTEKESGVIINVSSVVGIYGNVGQTNYAATKSGVIGMTKTWAKELGKKGVRVNAVAPGFIKTNMTAKVPEKILNKMEQNVPLGRLGEPIDVAKVYLFLASDEADYINGAVIEVTGGLTL